MDKKVIFIDWYGTLSDSKFWDHLDSPSFELIGNSLFGNLKHLINPWMRGEYTAEDVIHQVSLASNLDQKYLLREFIYSCTNMVVPRSALQLIKELRQKGTRVFIATDNMDSFSRWTTPSLSLNIHFDGILNSSDIKSLKRDFGESGCSLFFHKFLTENHLQPSDCILIDDNEDVDDQIKKYGIKYLKIDKSANLSLTLQKLLSKALAV